MDSPLIRLGALEDLEYVAARLPGRLPGMTQVALTSGLGLLTTGSFPAREGFGVGWAREWKRKGGMGLAIWRSDGVTE